MNKTAALLGALIACFIAASVATAGGEGGGGDGFVPVTLCHASPTGEGNSGPANQYELITVDNAGALNGHLGHPNDIIPATECPTPPPVDVCPNLEGNQSEVPDGYHLGEDENGRPACLPDENPPDVCPNLDGNQDKIPDGLVLDNEGNCVQPPPPDVCPNIDGTQTQVPDGIVVDNNGNCVAPTPPHEVTGNATVTCLLPAGIYQLSGVVDGQAADSVNPATLPGNTRGVTNVTVTRGDTSVRTAVSTNGDCGVTTTVTTPPPAVTPPVVTPPPSVTPPKAKPPVVKPKPPVKHKTVKPKTKPPVVHKKGPHVCLPLADGTKRRWYKGNGMPAGCYAVIQGSG